MRIQSALEGAHASTEWLRFDCAGCVYQNRNVKTTSRCSADWTRRCIIWMFVCERARDIQIYVMSRFNAQHSRLELFTHTSEFDSHSIQLQTGWNVCRMPYQTYQKADNGTWSNLEWNKNPLFDLHIFLRLFLFYYSIIHTYYFISISHWIRMR